MKKPLVAGLAPETAKAKASKIVRNKKRYRRVDWVAKLRTSAPSKIELTRYVENYRDHTEYETLNWVKVFSMLHTEVLLLLRYLSLRMSGPILEFGAYVGGATIALGTASAKTRRYPIISVEPGGAHNHPSIPTSDIFADLEKHLEEYACRDKVHLINGFSYQDDTRTEIEKELKGVPVDMLIIDSDGQVASDIERYSDLLKDGCMIVLDDYSSKRAPEKETLIKKWVDDAERDGLVTSLGVFGWGTWFGIFHKPK